MVVLGLSTPQASTLSIATGDVLVVQYLQITGKRWCLAGGGGEVVWAKLGGRGGDGNEGWFWISKGARGS